MFLLVLKNHGQEGGNMDKILIADDDKEIATLIADALIDEGYMTQLVYDGEKAIQAVKSNETYALIILDIMMPGSDGLEVCRRIRDLVTCPIIFVTAKKRVYDTMLGLEMGGDDYITKPFVVEELVARVKAHIRREARVKRVDGLKIVLAELTVDIDRYEVYFEGVKIDLTTREFQVLAYFAENPGRVLSKEMIFNHVWGDDYGDIGTVAVHIKSIRDKLGEKEVIKTVWGVGYKLVIAKE